jgi:hypothetical protein
MEVGLPMTTVRINAFRGSVNSFTVALTENGIPYHQIERLGDRPDAKAMVLEVPLTGGGEDTLAEALVAWLEARDSRRANIITRGSAVIWLEGYSAVDVAKVLEMTTHIAVMDARPTCEVH